MAIITIENVPDDIAKKYGKKISYDKIPSSFISKKRSVSHNRLAGLTKEEIEQKFYDKKDETYGPFKGEEATTFLKSLMSNISFT